MFRLTAHACPPFSGSHSPESAEHRPDIRQDFPSSGLHVPLFPALASVDPQEPHGPERPGVLLP